ncbi:hypothetical protein [Kribbella sancticallisti]
MTVDGRRSAKSPRENFVASSRRCPRINSIWVVSVALFAATF